MKIEQTECSETLADKIQRPGSYPEESIQHSEHGESLKSRKHPAVFLRHVKFQVKVQVKVGVKVKELFQYLRELHSALFIPMYLLKAPNTGLA
jgi:hypothetical protein